ncbi:unnamed protein product [Amoebophrya sp. A25]|nr:unnamed protein product [Amoebophrya sp. A25]|eukprot:GSA25T00017022001.1
MMNMIMSQKKALNNITRMCYQAKSRRTLNKVAMEIIMQIYN